MDYGKAKGIRKTKFGDMFAQRLLEGEGVGSSLKKTLSEKTKAKMTGIKETFDPMNMAKAVGGRGLAAMVGKMTGASDERMQYFAGKSKGEMELASDGKGGFSEEETKVLGQIYNAILKEREEKIKALGLEDEFQKQQISEEEKKTALLTEAVKGEKPKAEKPKKKPKKPPGSIIEGVIGGAVTAAAISDKEKEEAAARAEKEKKPEPPPPAPVTKPPEEVKPAPPKEEKPVEKPAAAAPEEKPAAAPPAAVPQKKVKPSEGKAEKVGSEQGKKAMLSAMNEAKISDPTQRAAIMAQVGVESGGFVTLSENLNYRAPTLLKMWPKKFSSLEDAQKVAAGGPESVAERIYGGRMGNAPEGGGEGFKFRGRGFIQLTGKQNYTKFGFAGNPDEVSSLKTAADIAIKYMAEFKGNWSDIKAVTKYVNGGYNHLDERNNYFQSFINDPSITKVGTAVASSSPAPSTPASSQVASASSTNKDLKDDMKKDKSATTVNNQVVASTENKQQPKQQESVDDRPIYLKKAQA